MNSVQVLLHGFTGSPASFQALELSGAITPALVGHDDCRATATNFRAEVDRIAELIPNGAQVVGYSLGARIALGVLLEHPGKIARATLIGAHPGLTSQTDRRARARADGRWIRLLEDQGIARFVDEWEALPLWASQAELPAHVLHGQRGIRMGQDARALAAALRALGLAEMPDYGARLAEIRIPVQIVAGERDAKFRALAERMHAGIQRSTLTLIAGCGHNPVIEQPQQIAALIGSAGGYATLTDALLATTTVPRRHP